MNSREFFDDRRQPKHSGIPMYSLRGTRKSLRVRQNSLPVFMTKLCKPLTLQDNRFAVGSGTPEYSQRNACRQGFLMRKTNLSRASCGRRRAVLRIGQIIGGAR
jgi:hypothetical protein